LKDSPFCYLYEKDIRMNKNKIFIWIGVSLLVILCLASAAMSYLAFKERNKPQEVIIKTEPAEYKVFIPEVPKDLEFCGEKVPTNDFDVHERVERELLVNAHWYSATILYLKRANRWFPVIEPILTEYGIPEDFKYMSVIESGLANVSSPAGASGFWQLMEPTAKKYGLEVNDEVDERYNIVKATRAACKYLKEAHAKYGNWTLTAASYNYGLNGVDRQISRQKTDSYYNLYLNMETYRFVARILAIKEIFKDPKKFGFDIKPENLYPPIESKKVIVDSKIKNLTDFAEENGINYKILKIMNPWLRNSTLSNRFGKKYEILIPEEKDFLLQNE
jgi:membrane-bound lytic murein transglycosylase D